MLPEGAIEIDTALAYYLLRLCKPFDKLHRRVAPRVHYRTSISVCAVAESCRSGGNPQIIRGAEVLADSECLVVRTCELEVQAPHPRKIPLQRSRSLYIGADGLVFSGFVDGSYRVVDE